MNPEQLTQKSQEAISNAQSIAARFGQTEVDGEHLLLALLEQEGGLTPRLFEKMDVPLEPFRQRLDAELQKGPRVSGPGAEAGKIYITQRLTRLLALAADAAKGMQDDYVSVEHLLLALLEEGGGTGRAESERH